MYSCEICDRQFLYKNSVNRHFRREHINKESRRRLKCTECDYACRFYHNLRTHIYTHHKIVCKVERRSFADFEEFKIWKRKFEETTHYLYVKHSSSKVSTTSNERKTYFVCHRTGTFQSGSCGKRRLKRQGSNKINASCPSTMEVVESLTDGTVKLVLWKTHVGHDAEITRTVLNDSERNWLAARINQGADYQTIMNEIQKMGDKGERMCFIKSQDIRNMRINLINSRNKNLLSELRAWVKNVQTLDDDRPTSSIVYFKDRGCTDAEKNLNPNDTMLIVMTDAQRATLQEYCCDMVCLDATHFEDDYEYHLLTLYTAAESDNWNPVVYCITNVFDVDSLRFFLSKVKENVGLIRCDVLLSDNNPPFYTAWCAVMMEPTHRFINLWYLERNWKENVLKIKSSDTIKTMVFSTLRLLLCESNRHIFQKKLDTFLEGLSLDSRLIDFRTYFQNEYGDRSKLWASYSWHQSGYRFEMQKNLEKLHKRLHDEYHRGVETQRLSDHLTKLISIAYECKPTRQFVNENSRSAATFRVQESHKRGVCIKRSEITQLSENDYRINIQRSNTYKIRWLDHGRCDCLRQCDVCQICAHEYSCTCVDYILYRDICEHVHACAIMRNNIKVDLTAETDAPLDSFVEEVICEEEIVCNVSDPEEEENGNSILLCHNNEEDGIDDLKRETDSTQFENNSTTKESLNFECADSTIQLDLHDCNRVALSICEPFATFVTVDDDDLGNQYLTEINTTDNLQTVALNNNTNENNGKTFVKHEDTSSTSSSFGDTSSSFGDTSSSVGDTASVYEDIPSEKRTIIALGLDGGDLHDSFIFRKYDENMIISHKMDAFLAFGDFDTVDNNMAIQLNEEQDFKYCYDDYNVCGDVDSVLTL